MPARTLLARPASSWIAALAVLGATEPAAYALDPFVNATDLLENADMSSGVALGAWDMNSDGLDDIIRMDGTVNLEIEYQQPDGSFVRSELGAIEGSSWSLSIGDIDNNGYADIFTGGAYDGLKVLMASDDGTYFDLAELNGPAVFVQCSNLADINNDGALDLFVCHDDGIASVYVNDGAGELNYSPELLVAASTVPSDNSGNYGTIFTDYDNDGDVDLYIAKCRLGVNDPEDGRRLNLLFQNDGSNNYSDVAVPAGLRPFAQSWSADFGDIDNDGDLDAFLVTHDVTSKLYRNDGPGALGVFVDITEDSNMIADLDDIRLGIQTMFEDFDNDGFIDLLVTGRSGEHRLFMNEGGTGAFTPTDPFPTNNHGIQSATIGDFNADGFPDLVVGFAVGFNEPSGIDDRLLLNPGNDNHWVDVRLTGGPSNRSGAGARVEVTSGGVTQIREVRAGQGYGITVSPLRHFGLGANETIDSIVVRWPSGTVDTIPEPPIDSVIPVTEGCPAMWYADVDGDLAGDANAGVQACIAPAGYVADSNDCDDADPNNFPSNTEICDDADNDCDRMIDEDPAECAASSSGVLDTGSGTSGETSGGSGATTLPGDGTVDPSSGTSGAPADGEGGCGCDVDRSNRLASILMLLVVAPWIRRRRSQTRP